jgi:hypothetical protein
MKRTAASRPSGCMIEHEPLLEEAAVADQK